MAWLTDVAEKRPVRNYTDETHTKTRIIYHTAASQADSLHGWFDNPDSLASSHFYVTKSGHIEQYVDTSLVAWATGDGKEPSVSVETEGDADEPWTDAQVAALVRLTAAIRRHHDIQARLLDDSDDLHGIGWHRLGVDGNFPATGLLAGRLQRGSVEVWSSVFGKTCPGDQRIHQIPGILEEVKGGTDSAAASADEESDDGERTPRDPDDGKWPEAYLTVRDHHTTYSHTAWRDLMHRIGIEKDSFTLECQTWLADLKDAAGHAYYTGRIDDDFGPMTTTALQEFLRDKGHYDGLIDGDRGPLTITAEHLYLNRQAEIIVNL